MFPIANQDIRPLGGFWSRKPGDRIVVIADFIASGRSYRMGEFIDEAALGWANFDLFTFCRSGHVHIVPEQPKKKAASR